MGQGRPKWWHLGIVREGAKSPGNTPRYGKAKGRWEADPNTMVDIEVLLEAPGQNDHGRASL